MGKTRVRKSNTPNLVRYDDTGVFCMPIYAKSRDLDPATRLDQLFSTGGDGSGTTDQATTAAKYSVVAPAGTVVYIERVCFLMVDASIRLNRYLGEAALSNGIKIYAKDDDDSLLHDYTPEPITIAGHFALLAGTDVPVAADVGDDTLAVRWTLAKAGHPLKLLPGQYIEIDIRDTLAGITSQLAQAQGWTEPE